ncbi:MAG: hypothetical protein P1U63_08000 [Coxiellaceae bacterium]|nr:hypothetical protein [Coxiellaceae bacterium]
MRYDDDRDASVRQVSGLSSLALVTQAGRDAAPASSKLEGAVNTAHYLDPPCT